MTGSLPHSLTNHDISKSTEQIPMKCGTHVLSLRFSLKKDFEKTCCIRDPVL